MSGYKTTLLVALLLLPLTVAAGLDPSYSPQATVDTTPFYPNGVYNESIPHPNEFTQHPLGQWPMRYHELVAFLRAVEPLSDRVSMSVHGQSYEGRDLYSLVISSEANMQRIDELREALARFADPDVSMSQATVDSLAEHMPASAWMGYSIHGDELSGMDAAAQLIYQLAAGEDSATQLLLDNIVIIVDPTQNPDGRERYLSMLQTNRSAVPNYDRFSLQHGGVWPWGRTNHYLFDLNRDWVLVRQQETKGKLATVLKWNPQLMVDGHEMGSNGSFLFSPPTQPINYNTPDHYLKWARVFSKEQAEAFDRNGWPYYTGEWNDQWYPGYGSAWGAYFGAIGILYEMAGVDGQWVKQQDDYLLTYHEAVNKQFTSSLSNLHSLANHRADVLRDYRQTRAEIVDRGLQSKLAFLIKPDRDEIKQKRFLDALLHQGIEVRRATAGFKVSGATDLYSQQHSAVDFPAGTYVVSTAQPNGALAKAILEFDPRLKLDFLKKERRELEKFNETKMYEISTWCLPQAYNLDAYTTTAGLSVNTEPVTAVEVGSGRMLNPEAQFGFVADMVGEKTNLLLTRLFEQNVVVRAAEKPFTIEGKSFTRGALVLLKRGNPDDLADRLAVLAEEIGIDIHGINTGYSDKGSLMGAYTYRLLTRPRVAMLTGDGMDYTSCGVAWFVLDQELGLPHSLIRTVDLSSADLSAFNVLLVPSSWAPLGSLAAGGGAEKIKGWVSDGGTLICMGRSAQWAADTATGLSQVRIKRQVLDKLAEYNLGVSRERQAESPEVDTIALWHPEKMKAETSDEKTPTPSLEEVKRTDEWQRRFFPRGVILKADLDPEHWLNFGLRESVPVMVYGRSVLMSKEPVETAARLADVNDLRVSGLLWPEARTRIANTAFCTRERKGKGQVILFLADPNVRDYFYGSRQMLVNAILYGPGMGTRFEGPYD